MSRESSPGWWVGSSTTPNTSTRCLAQKRDSRETHGVRNKPGSQTRRAEHRRTWPFASAIRGGKRIGDNTLNPRVTPRSGRGWRGGGAMRLEGSRKARSQAPSRQPSAAMLRGGCSRRPHWAEPLLPILQWAALPSVTGISHATSRALGGKMTLRETGTLTTDAVALAGPSILLQSPANEHPWQCGQNGDSPFARSFSPPPSASPGPSKRSIGQMWKLFCPPQPPKPKIPQIEGNGRRFTPPISPGCQARPGDHQRTFTAGDAS